MAGAAWTVGDVSKRLAVFRCRPIAHIVISRLLKDEAERVQGKLRLRHITET